MSNVLNRNCLYFQVPGDLITGGILGNMTESELKLYLSLLYKAQRNTTTTPKLTGVELANFGKLARNSATNARRGLIARGLIAAKRGVGNAYEYELLNPMSGSPMRNYLRRGSEGAQPSDGPSKLARRLFELSREEYEAYYRDRLPGAEIRHTANGLSSQCRFHDDRRPSLEINLDRGVWYCQACAVGGGMIDFETRVLGCNRSQALRSISSFFGWESATGSEEEPIATYDYADEDGVVLFQMVRFSDRDGERRIRARSPDPNEPDRWRWDVTGVRRVLYRLPQVLEAERVIVTEGEKDADTVCEFFGECPHSIVGTTNPFGAGKWEPAFSESLRGKDVVILPDNDQTGQVHADSVRSQLEGIAASVRVVNIPSEPGVKDVSDFLREHSGGELVDLIGLEWLGYMPA